MFIQCEAEWKMHKDQIQRYFTVIQIQGFISLQLGQKIQGLSGLNKRGLLLNRYSVLMQPAIM